MVSSVVCGYEDHRVAVAKVISARGGQPLLVNEETPSIPASPRTTSLDAVRRADAVITLVLPRGGTVAPSGKTVTEEEFLEARRLSKPRLAFIRKGAKDGDAERFAELVSRYVDGVYRTEFEDLEGLERQVAAALDRLLPTLRLMQRATNQVTDLARGNARSQGRPRVRLVVAPERSDELVDPMLLDSSQFQTRLNEVLHCDSVRLFDYAHASPASFHGTSLIIREKGEHDDEASDIGRLELGADGLLVLEAALKEPRHASHVDPMELNMAVTVAHISNRLRQAFAAAIAIYNIIDEHHTHPSLLLNAALVDLNYHTVEDKGTSWPSTSWGGRDTSVLAHENDRLVSREALEEPDREIERIVFGFRNNFKSE